MTGGKEEAAGVCGGRGALWDFNGSLGRKSFVSSREKGGLAIGAVLPRAERQSTEDWERGRGRWGRTRMRPRACARPRSETDL